MTNRTEIFDGDGYPSRGALTKIRNWKVRDQASLEAFWAFVRRTWKPPDYFQEHEPGHWYLSTGGWSGNEDVIRALDRNYVFWSLCWQQSRRGGHYIFHIADRIRPVMLSTRGTPNTSNGKEEP